MNFLSDPTYNNGGHLYSGVLVTGMNRHTGGVQFAHSCQGVGENSLPPPYDMQYYIRTLI